MNVYSSAPKLDWPDNFASFSMPSRNNYYFIIHFAKGYYVLILLPELYNYLW
jgi:hypothetical protein